MLLQKKWGCKCRFFNGSGWPGERPEGRKEERGDLEVSTILWTERRKEEWFKTLSGDKGKGFSTVNLLVLCSRRRMDSKWKGHNIGQTGLPGYGG